MADSDNIAHALAGAGGGALSMAITYPLINISTRAQTDRKKASEAKVSGKGKEKDDSIEISQELTDSTSAYIDLESGLSKKKRDCFISKIKNINSINYTKNIIEKEGIKGLYSGLESALWAVSASNFVYYYFYEGVRSVFQTVNGSEILTTPQSMLGGAVAGSATVILTNPMWVVNTRMTVKSNSAKNVSVIGTLKEIIKTDGVKALFSGIGPALILVINPIIQYTCYEELRKIILKKRKATALDAFLLGAISKLIATGSTYPYITLKSRLQLYNKEHEGVSSWQVFKNIIKTEGLGSLYKGIDIKLFQSVLTSAFLFYFK